MIKIDAQFINDAMHREPYRDPLNHIGSTVIADLSVWLMRGQSHKATFGTVPIWPAYSTNPRNKIGVTVLRDIRRTKQIDHCRVGNSSRFYSMKPFGDHHNV